MKKAKHKAISMTDTIEEKLKSLSKDLGIPESRIVNHLIALTYDNQVLKDLIKKINALPWICTKPETLKECEYVQYVYDLSYQLMADKINKAITLLKEYPFWEGFYLNLPKEALKTSNELIS